VKSTFIVQLHSLEYAMDMQMSFSSPLIKILAVQFAAMLAV